MINVAQCDTTRLASQSMHMLLLFHKVVYPLKMSTQYL